MTRIINDIIEEAKDTITSELRESTQVQEEITQFIKDIIAGKEGSLIPKRVDFYSNSQKIASSTDRFHPAFEKFCALVQVDDVWLWGPTGTGKSHMFFQWARIFDHKKIGYMRLDPGTPPSHLVGYQTANGNYVPTLFYHAVKEGFPFFIDEVCNGSEALLASLNTILSNRYASFPDGNDPFVVHENFRLVVADNTTGRGASADYNARRQQDLSFIERFAFLQVPENEELELQILNDIMEDESIAYSIQQAARGIRKGLLVTKANKTTMSPRGSYRIAKLIKAGAVDSLDEALEISVFKGLQENIMAAVAAYIDASVKSTINEAIAVRKQRV